MLNFFLLTILSILCITINTSAADTIEPDHLSIEELQKLLIIEPIEEKTPVIPKKKYTPSPGSSAGSPSGFGSKWRNIGIGFSYLSPGKGSANADTAIGLGTGLGNPDKLGFDILMGLIDSSEFGGQIGLKLHHRFNKYQSSVALGWANPIQFGNLNDGDSKETVYIVASHKFSLRPQAQNKIPTTFSIGVGTGGFRTIEDATEDNETASLFGSISFRILPRLSLNTGWTGSHLNLTSSLAPFNKPIILGFTAYDLTNERGNDTRFGFTISYGFRF